MPALSVLAAAVLFLPMENGVASAAPPDTATPAQVITEAPDEASALAAARQSGQRVEVLSERTETAQAFANPSGTFTWEQHTQPVRVRRDGGWVPVNRSLNVRPDGAIVPVATRTDVVFSNGGDTPLAQVSRDTNRFTLDWPGSLPAPRIEGDTVVYPEVLSGVDLVARAEVDGFAHVLVVKSAAAAQNPTLRRVAWQTSGGSVRVGTGGILTVSDGSGSAWLAGSVPRMWDSTGAAEVGGGPSSTAGPGPLARTAVMGVDVRDGGLGLIPDAALLTGSDTAFPLFIDPSWQTMGTLAWTHVRAESPRQSYWNYDREMGAKVGHVVENGVPSTYRSFFRMDTSPMIGKEILDATFWIHNWYSYGCEPDWARWVDLYSTEHISEATTWDDQPRVIEGLHQKTFAKGYSASCPSGDIDFNATAGVARVARDGVNTLTLRLTAHEGDPTSWKRFRPDPVLVVQYNSWPNPPSDPYADINLPCATGPNRPVTNTSPTLWATGSDPDGQNVEMEFVWHYNGNFDVLGAYRHPYQPSGSRFSAVIPTSHLRDGQSYAWRARAGDGARDWGPFGAWCEFTVDLTKPTAIPTVTSTSFPENDIGTPVGARGEFTFTSTDPDVHGYRFGLTQDTTYFVAAGSGTGRPATVPLTLWRHGPHELYAYSVDKAGNRSDTYRRYDFLVANATPNPPRVRGDVNGDGLADVAAMHQRDPDESSFLTFSAKGGGQWYEPVRTWDSGPNTAFLRSRLQSNSADINGDGRADLATLRDEGNNGITAWVFPANGTGYDAPAAPAWSSGPNQWALGLGRTAAGDLNGDGRNDLITFYNLSNRRTAIWVFYGTSTGLAAPVVKWDSQVGHWDWTQCREVAGDFDGDGKADVAASCNYPNRQTKIWLFRGTATGIAPPALAWDSGVGHWDWAQCREVASDFTGDGKADIGAWCDYGNGQTKLWLFRGTAIAVAAPGLGWDSGPGSTWRTALKPTAGDYNGDGKADLGYFYRYANNRTKLWTLDGAATGVVSPPVLRWDSGDWGLDWDRVSFF